MATTAREIQSREETEVVKWLLVDANSIAHVAKNTLGKLWLTHQIEDKLVPTGVIFGFLRAVVKFAENFPHHQFMFCWDSRRSLRRDFYPEYKMNRIHDREEVSPEEKAFNTICFEQFTQLRQEVLTEMGFCNNYVSMGLEADDVIAAASRQVNEAVIISRDRDLLQCLTSTCCMYEPVQKKFFIADEFTKEWGLPPSRWPEVKSLSGDAGDNISGIAGVAEPTAAKFLRGELTKGKIYDRIIEWKKNELDKRNLKLIQLPFEPLYLPLYKDTLTMDKLRFVFGKYGFSSFLTREGFEQWYRGFSCY